MNHEIQSGLFVQFLYFRLRVLCRVKGQNGSSLEEKLNSEKDAGQRSKLKS